MLMIVATKAWHDLSHKIQPTKDPKNGRDEPYYKCSTKNKYQKSRRNLLHYLLIFFIIFLASPLHALSCPREPLSLFVAASVSAAIDDLANTWLHEKQGCPYRLVVGASGTLARQLLQGAPGDLFIAAHPAWTAKLARETTAVAVPIAGNRLILAQPASGTLQWTRESLTRYLQTQPLVMGDPALVPLGQYGFEALTALLGHAPPADKLALAPSARHARALVERGGLAGILYASDGTADKARSDAVMIPGGLHQPILYQALLINPARRQSLSAFVTFLRSSAAAPVWEAADFSAITGTDAFQNETSRDAPE